LWTKGSSPGPPSPKNFYGYKKRGPEWSPRFILKRGPGAALAYSEAGAGGGKPPGKRTVVLVFDLVRFHVQLVKLMIFME